MFKCRGGKSLVTLRKASFKCQVAVDFGWIQTQALRQYFGSQDILETIGLTIVEGSNSRLDVGNGDPGTGGVMYRWHRTVLQYRWGRRDLNMLEMAVLSRPCEITVLATGRQILDGWDHQRMYKHYKRDWNDVSSG